MNHAGVRPTPRTHTPPRPTITARRIGRFHALMLPAIRRHDEHTTRLVITVYVRDSHGHTAPLELAPTSTVWWATERALISLADARRADECRLVFRGEPLRPRRSLTASGIDHGDTLQLVPATAIRRRRTLARTLAPRSLRQALKPKRRKQAHKRQS